jgi:hypothetical protein
MKEFKDISDKNPFKIPENYFKEVNQKIILSVSGNVPEIHRRSLYIRVRPYLAAAASIALLFALTFTAIHIFTPGKNNTGLPEITIIEFSDNYLNDIDNLTLEENTGSIEPNIAFADLNSLDIIDYLVLENIDVNDIYEQL